MAGRHLLKGLQARALGLLAASLALAFLGPLAACSGEPHQAPSYLVAPPPEGAVARAADPSGGTVRQAGQKRLRAWEAARGPVEAEALARWFDPPSHRPWLEEALRLTQAGDRPQAQAGAALAAQLLVACANAEAAASEARLLAHSAKPKDQDPELRPWRDAPAGPPEVAAVAGAASLVLGQHFPTQAEALRHQAEVVARCAEAAGVAYPHEVQAAYALGQACAQALLDAEAAKPLGPFPPLVWPSLAPPGSQLFAEDEVVGLAAHRGLGLADRAVAMALLKQEPSVAMPLWWAQGPHSSRQLARAALAARLAIASQEGQASPLQRPWPGLGQPGVEPLRPNPPGQAGPSAAVAGAEAYLALLGAPPSGSPQAELMASAVVVAAWSRPSEAEAGGRLGRTAAAVVDQLYP